MPRRKLNCVLLFAERSVANNRSLSTVVMNCMICDLLFYCICIILCYDLDPFLPPLVITILINL